MSETLSKIAKIVSKCGLPDKSAKHIDDFLQYILKANTELNLLSRKLTVDDILSDHIADCLVGAKYFAEYQKIADLGTGGGFPGLLLAIVYPDKQLSLYDKSAKKCQYLENAKKHLALPNVTVNNCLINQTKLDCDVITCRAFKSIPEIIDMTKAFFNKGGRYILYKARMENIMQDIDVVQKKYKLEYSIEKLGDREDKERNMVLLRKSK